MPKGKHRASRSRRPYQLPTDRPNAQMQNLHNMLDGPAQSPTALPLQGWLPSDVYIYDEEVNCDPRD